jgi:hypothetical protein
VVEDLLKTGRAHALLRDEGVHSPSTGGVA